MLNVEALARRAALHLQALVPVVPCLVCQFAGAVAGGALSLLPAALSCLGAAGPAARGGGRGGGSGGGGGGVRQGAACAAGAGTLPQALLSLVLLHIICPQVPVLCWSRHLVP